MIHVVAIITALHGQRDAVLAEFRSIMPLVRQERGCIQYSPVVDVADSPEAIARIGPDAFMVIEQWADRAAVDAHAASAHMAAYAGRVKGLLASRVIYALQEV